MPLFPKKPFYEQHELLASLSNSRFAVENLHIFVECPETRPDIIKGYIIGGKEESEKLSVLINDKEIYCTLTSASYENNDKHFESRKVRINKIEERYWPREYQDYIKNIVGYLQFEDISITHYLSGDSDVNQQIVFFLFGTDVFWPDWVQSTLSYTGNVTVKPSAMKLDLGELFIGEVTRNTWFFHSTVEIDGRQVMACEKCGIIQFEENKHIERSLGTNMRDIAVQLADDLVLMASFISRNRIVWFKYFLISQGRITYFIKSVRPFIPDKIYPEHVIINKDKIEFIKKAMENIQNLRNSDQDLSRPLMDILAGHEASTLEQKFTLYFLALEKIKDLYAKKRGISRCIGRGKVWKSIENGVKNIILSHVDDDVVKSMMNNKIAELNRPAIKDVFKKLHVEYGVYYEDLYPSGAELTLFNTRNRLIHSADEIDVQLLFDETYRLRSLVERVILAMLGWHDTSGAPHEGLRRYLAGDL
jgi:hypothetical protein